MVRRERAGGGGGRRGGGLSGTIDAALDKARDELYMNRKIMALDPKTCVLSTATQCCKMYCDICDVARRGSGGCLDQYTSLWTIQEMNRKNMDLDP